MDDGVVVVDFAGKVVTLNPAAARILDMPPENIEGQWFAEVFLVIEGLDAFTQMMLDAVSERRTADRQMVCIEVGGEQRVLTLDTSFLRSDDEQRVGIIAVFTDITATEALRESELALGRQVRAQYGQLQDAYRETEANNEQLGDALRRLRFLQRVAIAAGAAVLVLATVLVWNAAAVDADAAGSAPMADADGTPNETPVAIVPERLQTAIALTGKLEPRERITVLSHVDATVSEVYFQYGDRVVEGDPLVALDLGKVMQEYRDLRTGYLEAAKQVRLLDDWENGREVTAARRSLARISSSLEKQRHRLEETAFLLERGVIPAAEHAAAEEAYETLQSDHEIALQELAAVRASGGADAKEAARLQFENVSEQVAALETALATEIVRAPAAGVILIPTSSSEGLVTQGTTLALGDPVARIADVSTLSVSVLVDEVDVVDVRVGQEVVITSNAAPGLELPGRVSNVSSQALAGRSAGQSFFRVTVALHPLVKEQSARLRLGMSVAARIFTRDATDALLVPISAVRGGDRPTLRIHDPATGAVRVAEVETGATTLDRVQIVRGLKPGDQVLVPSVAAGR